MSSHPTSECRKMFNSLLLFVLISSVAANSAIGDKCTIESSGSPGECKILNKCPNALQALRNVKGSKPPQICGFQGTEPIVCCPVPAASQSQQRVPGQISKAKCKEYSKYAYQQKVQPVLYSGEDLETTKSECEFVYPSLIWAGKARKKEFPHMAIIGFEYEQDDIKWLCGGSLISESYVMTTAYCLTTREYGDSKYVRIGMTDLNENNSNTQKFNIAKRIRHPDYKPTSYYNDIGLLKLETQAELNSFARPACLFTEFQIPTSRAIATGWGKTSYAGERSDDLHKHRLEFVDQNSCNQSYRSQIGRKLENGIAGEIQVCAKVSGVGTGLCQGGGPLQIYHHDDGEVQCMYDVVGIISFGRACGIGGSPDVFTRVSGYIKWIEDIVWPL